MNIIQKLRYARGRRVFLFLENRVAGNSRSNAMVAWRGSFGAIWTGCCMTQKLTPGAPCTITFLGRGEKGAFFYF